MHSQETPKSKKGKKDKKNKKKHGKNGKSKKDKKDKSKTLTEEQKQKKEQKEREQQEKKAQAEKRRNEEKATRKAYKEKVGESRKAGFMMYMHAWAYWYLIRQSSTGTFIWALVMTSHSVPSLSSPSHAAVDEPADDEDWGCSLQDLSRQEPVPWLQNAWGIQTVGDSKMSTGSCVIVVITSNDSYSQFPLSFACMIYWAHLG